ncbi:hypothetical protein OG730_43910 (plasmid) [Streptomyces sp. NBC_01298]|uniref:hypothetical protein n=1 Tax=Streptomyces sp. NBC_01298 TaxID=2903817 RepID=UPI002E1649AB|nr:hypothetical protein OG730_43885 [Streptomyces sp. NBC_01298]WSK26297.1 hypothetical protein OG730_43910 [Streptomyces sp. NBC_01298]
MVPLAAEDVVALGSDGEQLAALYGLALLRTGRMSGAELAVAIEGSAGPLERLETVRDALP